MNRKAQLQNKNRKLKCRPKEIVFATWRERLKILFGDSVLEKVTLDIKAHKKSTENL